MMKSLLIATLGFCLGLNEAAFDPTQADITSAKQQIGSLIDANAALGPKFLRLIFHDCVSKKCDGCINFDIPDNNGLKEVINTLDNVYTNPEFNFNQKMSRADFWVLASIEAIDVGVNNDEPSAARPPINFVPGRVDCPTSPRTKDPASFPHSKMKPADMFKYFKDHFDFNANETTTIMGAHTLGRAVKENSGHIGRWTMDGEFSFDKAYYHLLVEESYLWTQQNVGTDEKPVWQWHCQTTLPIDNGESCGIMLPTDINIIRELQLNDVGYSSCEFLACKLAPTNVLVEKYDQSQEAFYQDFGAVFTKLINRK